jgi:ribosome-associated protein
VREPLEIRPGLTLPAEEIAVEFARSGGPGGQNVNKVETKVVLRFDVAGSRVLDDAQRARIASRMRSRMNGRGELLVACDEHRERARNWNAARERLAALLREALRVEKPRRATRPTAGSVRRRLGSKKRRSERKHERRSRED